MKLTHEDVTLRTKRTFRIATESSDAFPVVIARLATERHEGLGEAAPSARVTRETPESVRHFLDWAAKEVASRDVDAWEPFLDHVHDDICGNPSARCALDLAVHDLVARMQGVPARSLYDLPPGRIETCITVSLDEPSAMADEARAHAAAGFGALKLKLGDAARDVERVEAVRAAAPRAKLRADANTGWTRAEAARLLPKLAELGVDLVEQPVPPARVDDLVDIARDSPIPIYADESVLDAHDVERLNKAGFVGGVNLKLQKCGGLRPTVKAARLARGFGYGVQLGCMIESGIGIAAGTQLLALLDHADLDGHLLLARDPHGGPRPVGGWYDAPTRPGLGFDDRA